MNNDVKDLSVCPTGYSTKNSYVDSLVYVSGYPNSESNSHEIPESDLVGVAITGSSVVHG